MVEQIKAACATLRQKQEARGEARRFLRRRQVEYLTGLSRSAIYAGIAAGTFPKPCALSESGRSVAWVEREVDAWIESRIAARGVTA